MGSKAVSSEKLKFAAKSFVPGIKLAHLPDFYSSYIHAHTYIQSSVIQDTTNIFTFPLFKPEFLVQPSGAPEELLEVW